MSVVLDAGPLVLEETDQAEQCGWNGCEDRATWSTLWSCGETWSYCVPHLRQVRRESEDPEVGIVCCCLDDGIAVRITIVAEVPV